MSLKLFRLKTGFTGDNHYVHVLAPDATTAIEKLEKEFDIADYGLTRERKVLSVEVVAKELHIFPEYGHFSGDGEKFLQYDKDYHVKKESKR